MKTNLVMIRKVEEIDFPVYQRTSDGKFNLTAIVKYYNDVNGTDKDLKEFLNNKGTLAFAETIARHEIREGENFPHLNGLTREGYSTYVLETTRGKNGGSWGHPLLFIDAMMWLSPEFKYTALKMVQDQLIKFRHLSGDQYKEMCPAIERWYIRNNGKKPNEEIYAEFATIVKLVVFEKNVQHSMWQKCSEADLVLRRNIEIAITKCLDNNDSLEDIMKQCVFVKSLKL